MSGRVESGRSKKERERVNDEMDTKGVNESEMHGIPKGVPRKREGTEADWIFSGTIPRLVGVEQVCPVLALIGKYRKRREIGDRVESRLRSV